MQTSVVLCALKATCGFHKDHRIDEQLSDISLPIMALIPLTFEVRVVRKKEIFFGFVSL
jgi:hypothetical protein